MSVILDALRRARVTAPPRPGLGRPVGIPAGLRVGGSTTARLRNSKGTRWGLLAGVVGAAVVVGAVVQFALPVLLRRAAAPLVVATGVRSTGAEAPVVSPPAESVPAPASAAPPDREQPAPAAASDIPSVPASQRFESPRGPAAVRRRAPAPVAPAIARPAPAPLEPPLAAALPPAPPQAQTPGPAAADVNHFDLALRYQGLGNFEQALTHYSAVLQTQEFNVEARNNLGMLYLDRGLISEAIDQFRRAILINPDYLKARSNLGVALMNAGRLDEARAELRAALSTAPRNVELLVNQALVEKAAHQPEQAKEILLRALAYQPTHAAAHYNLAVLFDEAGETARAYDHYSDFLTNAGPEFGARISDVRRRLDAIAPRLDAIR